MTQFMMKYLRLAWQSLQLLQNEPRCASMRRAMQELGYAGAAARICKLVCEEA